MKNILLVLTIVMFSVSCTTVKISSDFDKTAAFANYKTYKFTEDVMKLPVDDLNKNRLIAAVEKELGLKGFTKSEIPDVMIDIQLKGKNIQTATASTSGGYGHGYRYGWGGGFSTTTINYDSYIEGTLFVDMIDASKNQLVWQGRGVGTLDPDADQAKREKNINYAVSQIFTKYPPVIGK